MPTAAGIALDVARCLVVLRDVASGAVVRRGRASPPDRREGPEAWWEALVAAVVDAGLLADVQAFALASGIDGCLVLDSDGRILAWLRSAQARTGLELLREWRSAEPAAAASADAIAAPGDWLLWRLRGFGPFPDATGGPLLEELTTSPSEAELSGAWNGEAGRWRHDLVEEALGVAPIKPRVMSKPDAWGGESAKRPELGIRTGRVIGRGATAAAAAELARDVLARDGDGDAADARRSIEPDDPLALAATGAAAGAAWALTHQRPHW